MSRGYGYEFDNKMLEAISIEEMVSLQPKILTKMIVESLTVYGFSVTTSFSAAGSSEESVRTI